MFSISFFFYPTTHIDQRYWVFNEYTMEKNYPKTLKELGTGLPKDKLDAALYYTPTGMTYFFRGDK